MKFHLSETSALSQEDFVNVCIICWGRRVARTGCASCLVKEQSAGAYQAMTEQGSKCPWGETLVSWDAAAKPKRMIDMSLTCGEEDAEAVRPFLSWLEQRCLMTSSEEQDERGVVFHISARL